jgi:hypothetical protein
MARRLSSIFSFETLKLAPRFSAALVMALVLLGICEVTARVLYARGDLDEDASLHKVVRRNIEQLERTKPEIWLVGNSVLARGVDEDLLRRELGIGIARLRHGSATARAGVVMSDYYIRRTGLKPRALLLLMSKDDMNKNGERHNRSWKRYYTYRLRAALGLARHSMLYRTRLNLGEQLSWENVLEDVDERQRQAWNRAHRDAGMTPAALVNEEDVFAARRADDDGSAGRVFDGQPMPDDDPWMIGLARQYEADLDAFVLLKEVARRHDIPYVGVILAPITNRNTEWHDRRFPHLPWSGIREELARILADLDIPFWDHADQFTDHALFGDSYHLNESGREIYTRHLVKEMTRRLPDDTGK